MKNYIQIFLKSIILISFLFLTSCDQKNEGKKKAISENLENDQKILTLDSIKRISEGEERAKITIIAYESLTCNHCADFHKNVYPSLKKDFIDRGLVKIEFRNFPLNILAVNASMIAQCNNDGKSNIMHILYSGQKKWAKGTSEEANGYLKKFLIDQGVKIDFEKCLANKSIEDYVLEDRIEGQKKYKVNATPTIIINDKKFDKALNYKNLKNYLEKLI